MLFTALMSDTFFFSPNSFLFLCRTVQMDGMGWGWGVVVVVVGVRACVHMPSAHYLRGSFHANVINAHTPKQS